MKQKKSFEIDMCSGPIFGKMLAFALPVMLMGILQLLFNAADLAVVGQFDSNGQQSLAAVGSTGSMINLLVNVFMGLAVGANVLTARRYGANDVKGVQAAVHTAIASAALLSFFVMALGIFACRPILEAMSTPADALDGAVVYVTIYFIGAPFNLLYNFGASILRAVGDTKRPLIFLTIAGVVNVLLNLLFVIVFHMSVAGVAWATVISQVISSLLVLRCLCHSDSAIHLDLRRLRIDKAALKEIARVGLPAGIQGSIFSISNVLIQSAVNSFGSATMAGNAASSSLEGFGYTSMNAMFQANQTFISQNVGARKPERLNRIFLSTIVLVMLAWAVVEIPMYLLGSTLLGIYNSEPEVISYGMLRMGTMMATHYLCGLMDAMVGQLRGMGYSIMPMIVSLLGACGLRVVWLYTVFAASPTLETLYLSYPISWGVTLAIHLICYFCVLPKVKRRLRTAEA